MQKTIETVSVSRRFMMTNKAHRTLLIFLCKSIFLLSPLSLNAAENPEWLGAVGLSDGFRYTVDFSSRSVHFRERDETGAVYALGLDIHNVFSNRSGDYGTLNLQGYLTHIENLPVRPGFFDGPTDTEFVYRIFNFNYTGLGKGLPNIRVGHLEVPFGLEQTINTNGTFRDYNSGRNLGVKADWGVSLNDDIGGLEYEVSYTTGGGQRFKPQNGSYVYAGRVGSSRDRDLVLGLSVYSAEVGNARRERVGVDGQFYFGVNGVFTELAAGKRADANTRYALVEYNRRTSREKWLGYVQFINFSQEFASGWDNNLITVFGVRYEPDGHWSLSGQLKNDLAGFEGAIEEMTTSLQVRYRL